MEVYTFSVGHRRARLVPRHLSGFYHGSISLHEMVGGPRHGPGGPGHGDHRGLDGGSPGTGVPPARRRGRRRPGRRSDLRSHRGVQRCPGLQAGFDAGPPAARRDLPPARRRGPPRRASRRSRGEYAGPHRAPADRAAGRHQQRDGPVRRGGSALRQLSAARRRRHARAVQAGAGTRAPEGGRSGGRTAASGRSSLDDRFAEAHYLLGVALRETGKPEEAIKSLRRAVEAERRAGPGARGTRWICMPLADARTTRSSSSKPSPRSSPTAPSESSGWRRRWRARAIPKPRCCTLRRAAERHPDSPPLSSRWAASGSSPRLTQTTIRLR